MSSEDPFRHFSADDIQRVERTTFVRKIEHHASLPSTNSQALSRMPYPHECVPTLVLTDEQTAGRGRAANQWWSAAGALTFSLILDRPELTDAVSLPCVALTTGIAVCEALHQLQPGLDAALKWPNDVYVRSRKICGILVETPTQAMRQMVIGVGVNVNNRLNAGPASLRSSATSLIDVAGYPFSLSRVLIAILNQLSAQLFLLENDPAQLQQRWETYCMLTGKRVQIVAGSRRTIGLCLGIDAQGALLVETSTGTESCLSGEVVHWD